MASSVTLGYTKFIGKSEVLNYPIFGYMLRNFYISVNRNDSEDRYKSLIQLEEALVEGASIIIFPESTRNISDKLIGPFKLGAFRLSLKTKTPIAMFTALNSKHIMAANNWWLKPGNLFCQWDIIDWTQKEYSEENTEELSKYAWEKMNNNMKKFIDKTNV